MSEPRERETGVTHYEFGVLCRPLAEQVGFTDKDVTILQRAADSVAYLKVHGYLSDGEAHTARRRIVKALDKLRSRRSPQGGRKGDHDG